MGTRVYTYVKDTDYSQVLIADNAGTPITYDLIYNEGKLTTVKDTNSEPLEKLITFSRDVNDEAKKIIDHKNKIDYIVTQADSSMYNEFWKRPDNYTKISEYNMQTNIMYQFTFDKSTPVVNRTPISILREISMDNITCDGVQSEITGIQSPDTTIQIIPTFVNGKIQSVLGTNTNTPAVQWKVIYTYNGDKLERMDEYSYRKDALGRLSYLIDATFTFRYAGEKLSYILCTGTTYKRIDMQYNSVGNLVATYRTTTLKILWFKVLKNRIEYNDIQNSQVVYGYAKPELITSVDMNIDGVQANLIYNYDVTKINVNRFFIPGLIIQDGSVVNLCKFNIDMNGEQTNLESLDFKYNGILYYKLVPNYSYGKIKSLDILDYPTLTKLGYIRYFYNQNKISQIETYYTDKHDASILFSTFNYIRNPYNQKDRTLKIDHNYIASGANKLGSFTFKLSDNMQIDDIYDDYGKVKIGTITYDKNNEPITCSTETDSPVATNISSYKLADFFEITKGGIL
jgi:hypothetical protein